MPKYKELSVKYALDIAMKNEKVMKYLPELTIDQKLDARRVDRNFLFNVLNTIDPNFFPRAVTEIESSRVVTAPQAGSGKLKVDPAMIWMFKQYVATHKFKHRRSAIGLVKEKSKKRKRSEIQEPV